MQKNEKKNLKQIERKRNTKEKEGFERKILQNGKYVTELLNVYYNSMNSIDFNGKRFKMIIVQKG